ncbi:MAG: agmatinase [Magnetococcales bacterium]|nr:agmatinase [Magnetococcales bacterium]MBF0155070.1 agmatinase [Magnetococcales bacterium]
MIYGGGPQSPLDESPVVVLPIPYGATLTYRAGAADGPAALLAASAQMELFDDELGEEIIQAGIHTAPTVEPNLASPEAMMATIRQAALPHLQAGRFLAAIGGDHSITVGLLQAFCDHFGTGFSVLQLDAHADLRESYHGTPLSHACVMHNVAGMGLPFVQVGIRSLSEPEWNLIRQRGWGDRIFWARDIVPAAQRQDEAWMARVVEQLAPLVYVTLDLDALDPAIMPAVGTPEPGGLDYYTVLRLLRRVTRERRVVGFDINELSPLPGQPAGEFMASRILYKMIGYVKSSAPPD